MTLCVNSSRTESYSVAISAKTSSTISSPITVVNTDSNTNNTNNNQSSQSNQSSVIKQNMINYLKQIQEKSNNNDPDSIQFFNENEKFKCFEDNLQLILILIVFHKFFLMMNT